MIATTLDVAAAARYAEHVHGLAHRAQLCASIGSSSSTDETDVDDLQMLCIGSRHRELLLCADRISGTAVIVEQDRHFVQPAANAKSKSDEEWLRRRSLPTPLHPRLSRRLDAGRLSWGTDPLTALCSLLLKMRGEVEDTRGCAGVACCHL